MKHKITKSILPFIFCLIYFISLSFSFLTVYNNKEHTFTLGKVLIELNAELENKDNIETGSLIEIKPTIKNVGNTDCYAFVIVGIPYYYDNNGQSSLFVQEKKQEFLKTVNQNNSGLINENWTNCGQIKLPEQFETYDENLYNYYLYVYDIELKSGESTNSVFDFVQVLEIDNSPYLMNNFYYNANYISSRSYNLYEEFYENKYVGKINAINIFNKPYFIFYPLSNQVKTFSGEKETVSDFLQLVKVREALSKTERNNVLTQYYDFVWENGNDNDDYLLNLGGNFNLNDLRGKIGKGIGTDEYQIMILEDENKYPCFVNIPNNGKITSDEVLIMNKEIVNAESSASSKNYQSGLYIINNWENGTFTNINTYKYPIYISSMNNLNNGNISNIESLPVYGCAIQTTNVDISNPISVFTEYFIEGGYY